MFKRTEEIIKRAGYYIETAIWSGIGVWVMGWLIYIRVISEKSITDIPAKSHPFGVFAGHVFILGVLISVSVLMSILSSGSKIRTEYKSNQWPKVKKAVTILSSFSTFALSKKFHTYILRSNNFGKNMR